jgi:hypothetical protein
MASQSGSITLGCSLPTVVLTSPSSTRRVLIALSGLWLTPYTSSVQHVNGELEMEQQNVTISLSADLIREAKHLAVARGVSVSRFVAMLLEERVQRAREFQAARDRLWSTGEGVLTRIIRHVARELVSRSVALAIHG